MGFLLKEKLQAEGYSVFYDTESLSSGKFDDKLLDVISQCGTVLAILSAGSLDSCSNKDDWMRRELSHAIKQKKNIVPIMMNRFEWPDNLPEDLSTLKFYNGVKVSFDFFDGFMEKLRRCIVTPQPILEGHNGLKHVLFWADFGIDVMGKIIKRLSLPDEYYVEMISDPVEMLSKDFSIIESIVLLDTDVTKLANNDFAIKRINDTLYSFVCNGGHLIATHDIIYRRTRNVELQKLFGCQITNFRQMKEVCYQKTSQCLDSGLFKDIPETFILHDDEICWGEIAPDVDVFFETPDGIPLVFGRECGDGSCIYMNPGDFKNTPSRSIMRPEPEFIQLLQTTVTKNVFLE